MVTVLDDGQRVAGGRAATGSAAAADAVAQVFAQANVWLARAHAALANLSEADVWADDGSVSTTAWLRGRVGLTATEATRSVHLARLVGAAPVLAGAWQEGALSTGQVAAVRANVDRATQALFVEEEATLVPVLVPLSVTETALAMQAWKADADARLGRPDPADEIGVVHHRQQLDGTWQLDGTLGVEAGAVVDHALRLAADRADGVGDRPASPAQRRAEALVEVCSQFLAGRPAGEAPVRGRRRRPHVHLVIEHGRGRLVGGGHLSAQAAERLACDANLHRLVRGAEGEVLDHGRATATVTSGLWAALVLRDAGCRHPGCDRPVAWCDAHHVIPFGRGGGTSLANLVLTCRRHHTLAHSPGWAHRLDADGTLHVTDTQGRTHTSRPPGLPPP